LFSGLLLIGTIAGSVYQIAVPTLVTILVPTEIRDKANGMLGTVMGVGFAITSVASGFTLAYGGMEWVLVLASLFTAVAIGYLMTIPIPENEETPGDGEKEEKKIDLTGTIKAIRKVPGLFALIFFTTFNNLVGGVFMALMDAYGLSLVSVQAWGTLWGLLSFGFILGGLAIAKWGLGTNPLRTLFRVNSLIWVTCILFPLQPSIVLVAMGAFVWMSMFPYIEATEQTIIQKVVPAARQGRVFGFAHSVEQAATPLTAFLIGPITQLFFIPLMTTGIGARLIGGWFGTGEGRGIAVVFILAGVIGLLVTSVAQRSSAYAKLAVRYRE
jgi:DHA3 family multidrug efflux protein-like MFS transporter